MKTLVSTFFIALLAFTNISWASDHIDGVPSLTKHQQVDLTDLYVFKNGQQKRNISVVLNLYPGVGPKGHFSKKVSYNIIIRPAYLNSPSVRLVETDEAQAAVINCNFTDPAHHHIGSGNKYEVNCTVYSSSQTITSIDAEVGKTKVNSDQSMKIYTGSRSDAFFITREHFDSVTKRQEFVSKVSDNLMEKINVLSIALEIEMDKLFPDSQQELYAVAAESYTSENGSTQVLDRVGRPEITNLSLHAFDKAQKLKRKYNQTKAFVADLSQNSPFIKRLADNISAYDQLDGTNHWNHESLNELTRMLADDFLVFSVSPHCADIGNNYLEIEKAVLRGLEPSYCGGRKITDDIMNTLYALYIGGIDADMKSFETGVSRPYQSSDKVLSNKFPYLADPEKGINAKQILLNTVIKASQE